MYQPEEIREALDQGVATFEQYPVEMDFAAGSTSFTISPIDKDHVWQIFVATFGEITPSPPTGDFYFEVDQVTIEQHNIPMLHSILDNPYPLWTPITQANPLRFTAENNTGVQQTIDFQLFFILFKREQDYAKWYADLILKGLRLGADESVLSVVGYSLGDFNNLLEDRITYWRTQHDSRGVMQVYDGIDQIIELLQDLGDYYRILIEIETGEPPPEKAPPRLRKDIEEFCRERDIVCPPWRKRRNNDERD